ncbi:metallophosphatase family protein [Acidimicrobiia bacterium EGI L10123]|uniref:metallophosphoesterase family protein n=1 Tax=Salinilacustrithrix flava TaxID=2957203 RepID=UPI003D7C2518|nr:metallophosphatase family protein [Acidimicrobiia bacterium EGI L10123]
MSTRIVVLADTHVARGSTRRLPDAVYAHLDGADAIWHAGDVLVPELLDELAGFAPVEAVLGNNDHELLGILPERTEEIVDGVRIAMVHDSGTTKGRERRMRRWFPDADLVVFGHSHQPVDVVGVDGQRLLNPGSPTQRRRAPTHTIGIVTCDDGHLQTEIVDVT